MKILHVLPSVDPKGGGPIEGVKQRGQRLLEMGHQVEVVCLDAPESDFLRTFPLPIHALGPTTNSYRLNKNLTPWMRANANRYDAVVINGMWQYHGFGAWRALRHMQVPYFVFTHGMLDPWFKRTYPLKHLKKWLYWPWADYRVLRDASLVLFTSEEERVLARQSFWLYRAKERVVAYGTRNPPCDATALREQFFKQHPTLRGKRLILFLSRIHEKKGCDLLVEAYAKLARQYPDTHLVMAGPDQTGWVPELQAMSERAGIADRITWPGMLQGDMKWGAFYASEVFCLPSHQENFGIAVAEALCCGLPVLTTDKVNIWREIESDKAGMIAPDTAEGIKTLLEGWLALDAPARAEFAKQSLLTFSSRFSIDAMATSLVDAIRPFVRGHQTP